MANAKIDPRKPGASSMGNCDPHGRIESSAAPHAGLSRGSDGSFASMSYGGESPDGDAMVAKYRPGGGGKSTRVRSGSELNGDGDDWAD